MFILFKCDLWYEKLELLETSVLYLEPKFLFRLTRLMMRKGLCSKEVTNVCTTSFWIFIRHHDLLKALRRPAGRKPV